MGLAEAEVEVERIMKNCDTDKNGHIDYSEFISATIDKRKLLSKERLKHAFSIFDRVNFILYFQILW
jgi:calcium-dependent protein kinase